jgi:hypothetical protein
VRRRRHKGERVVTIGEFFEKVYSPAIMGKCQWAGMRIAGT